jgi:hypothetical protein
MNGKLYWNKLEVARLPLSLPGSFSGAKEKVIILIPYTLNDPTAKWEELQEIIYWPIKNAIQVRLRLAGLAFSDADVLNFTHGYNNLRFSAVHRYVCYETACSTIQAYEYMWWFQSRRQGR